MKQLYHQNFGLHQHAWVGRQGGSDPNCGYHWCWLKGRRGGNSSKFDKILIDLKNTTTFSMSKAVKVRAFLHKFPNFSTKISQKKNENVNKVKCLPIKLNFEGVITIVCIFWKFLQIHYLIMATLFQKISGTKFQKSKIWDDCYEGISAGFISVDFIFSLDTIFTENFAKLLWKI